RAGIPVLAILVLDLKETLTGYGHVQFSTGILLGTIFGEVLGHIGHFHTTGLTTGIQRRQFRTTGLEACSGYVGNVLGNHVQVLVGGPQTAKADVKTHCCAPRKSLTLDRDRLPSSSS